MRKDNPQRAVYTTLLKSHSRTGSTPQIRWTLTEHSPRRTSPDGCFCVDIQKVKILKSDFVKRNLLKVKTHVDVIKRNLLKVKTRETIVLIGCDR